MGKNLENFKRIYKKTANSFQEREGKHLSTYKIQKNIDNWDFENGFYLTCENNRISDFISRLELYKMILDLPGDILEFGVFKGSSFIQFLSFREYYENSESRSIIGFDAFGKFPNELKSKLDISFAKDDDLKNKSDRNFVKNFEEEAGHGISEADLDIFLKKKNLSNYSLIRGNIIETLPSYLTNNPEKKFSLIHIDVDVYEPTILTLKNTWDKIVKGGILILDDYACVEGTTRAVDEFFQDKDILIQKLPYKYKPSFIIKE